MYFFGSKRMINFIIMMHMWIRWFQRNHPDLWAHIVHRLVLTHLFHRTLQCSRRHNVMWIHQLEHAAPFEKKKKRLKIWLYEWGVSTCGAYQKTYDFCSIFSDCLNRSWFEPHETKASHFCITRWHKTIIHSIYFFVINFMREWYLWRSKNMK